MQGKQRKLNPPGAPPHGLAAPARGWCGGGRCGGSARPAPRRGGPGSPGAWRKVPSVTSLPPPQVQVASGEPPGTSLQKAGACLRCAGSFCRPWVYWGISRCPSDPHYRTFIQVTAPNGFGRATLGFPGSETTQGPRAALVPGKPLLQGNGHWAVGFTGAHRSLAPQRPPYLSSRV